MLYFSKIKLFIIYLIIVLLSFFSFLNFIDKNKLFISKKINLGLDLQGGSYLLLEVDSTPIINQNLQQKLLSLRKFFKKNKIKYKNLEIKNQSIKLILQDQDKVAEFEEYFINKNNGERLKYIPTEEVIVKKIFLNGIAKGLNWFDTNIVDRVFGFIGWLSLNIGILLRQMQNGQLQTYGGILSLGIILIMIFFIFF